MRCEKMQPKIVSLIPSATEIVHALGFGDCQLGRSHECDYPESVLSLPVCTAPKFAPSGNSREIDQDVRDTLRDALSVYDVFHPVLEQLQPSHIITQSQCEVCAVNLKDVELAVGKLVSSDLQLVSLEAHSWPDVLGDIACVAEALQVESKGRELVKQLEQRMEGITDRACAARERPRVACLEWLEPLMAAGNWVPELVQRAGGENLLGEAGEHSGPITWESLLESDPEILVLMPCGLDMKQTREEMYWLTDRAQWKTLKAVQNGRVYLTDGNHYFNRPGPRLVESLEILGEIIHPDLFAPSFKERAWQEAG